MTETFQRWFPTLIKVAVGGAILAIGVYAYQEVQERRLTA